MNKDMVQKKAAFAVLKKAVLMMMKAVKPGRGLSNSRERTGLGQVQGWSREVLEQGRSRNRAGTG